MKHFRALAFALGLIAAPAAAQVPNWPQTLPANTVVGRLGIGPGPAQAIPFATFQKFLNTAGQNLVYAGPSSGGSGGATFRALVGADLPLPGASSIGGVQSTTCAAGSWINSISTSGVPGCAQPSLSQTFDTVAALNAATIDGSINAVTTLGYYARGDGGGLTYTRVASAPSQPCYQTSNSTTVYWDIPERSKINVKWCGAKGDGTTADDTAISNSITALPSRGGTVNFPAGNYVCAGTCINLLNRNGVSFEGAGTSNGSVGTNGPSTITFTGATGTLVRLDGTEAISFNNLNFSYTSTSYSGVLVDLKQASGGVVTSFTTFTNFRASGVSTSAKSATLFDVGKTLNTYFNHGFIGNANFGILGAISSGGTTFSNGTFINNIWFDTYITVPIVAGGYGWELRDSLFEPPRGDGQAIAIYTTPRGVDGFIISGNQFDDASSGTWINFTSNVGYGTPGPVTGLSVSGNFFQGAATTMNFTSANGVSITGNSFSQTGSAVHVTQATSTHLIIYGNNYVGSGAVINATPSGSLVETNP